MTDVHRELAIDDIWSVNITSITTVPLLVFLGILSDQQSNYIQKAGCQLLVDLASELVLATHRA